MRAASLMERGDFVVRPRRACVLGASGGIGAALVEALDAEGYDRIYAGARREIAVRSPVARPFRFDILDEDSLDRAARGIAEEGELDLVIVATGMLHRGVEVRPEKSVRQVNPASMQEVFAVNTIGPALAAKYFLPLLARDRRAVIAFLSARVGSIADNRLGGWHSYRASKAALNALVRCFAIELAQRNRDGIAVALHPGTVDTRLSMPFRRSLAPGQLQRADISAACLLDVLETLTPADSGGFFGWDGNAIPY